SPSTAVLSVLNDLKLTRERIGCEKQNWNLTGDRYEDLRKALPDASMVDATEVVEGLRAIKSAAEIEYLRRAARISDLAVQAGIDAVRDGVSENDVAKAILQTMIAEGGEYIATWPNIKA